MMQWIWIILALVYLLSPYDLIPGFSAVSWLDDLFILVLLYRYLSRFKRMRSPGGQPYGGNRSSGEPSHDNTTPKPKSPYEVLGVRPGAGRDEIKAAYRKLAGQYHPDKVAHLGDEFQTMAEQRFKEIQEAYQELTKITP
jgi:DnaJ-domain-containing protein 1